MVIKIWNWKSRSHIQCQYGPRRKVNMDKKVTCSQSIKLEAITFCSITINCQIRLSNNQKLTKKFKTES